MKAAAVGEGEGVSGRGKGRGSQGEGKGGSLGDLRGGRKTRGESSTIVPACYGERNFSSTVLFVEVQSLHDDDCRETHRGRQVV